MLKKSFRIGSRDRISQLLSKGRRRSFSLFRCSFLPNRLQNSRFAVIVGKSVSKKAVERNRLRRQFYEALRTNWSSVGGSCYDVAVLVYPQASGKPYSKIEYDLITGLQQL